MDALAEALVQLGRFPASGSPSLGQALDLPGLRAWPVPRFPFLLFYMEQADHLDLWRMLHARADLPQHLNI